MPNQRYGMQFQLYGKRAACFMTFPKTNLVETRRTNTAAGTGTLLDLGRRAARKVTRGVLRGG